MSQIKKQRQLNAYFFFKIKNMGALPIRNLIRSRVNTAFSTGTSFLVQAMFMKLRLQF